MHNLALAPHRPVTRLTEICRLLDEAQTYLAARDLADLLLAVRGLLGDRSKDEELLLGRNGFSPAVRVYLRPVHVRLASATYAPLPTGLTAELLRYLDEVAARPRGASPID